MVREYHPALVTPPAKVTIQGCTDRARLAEWIISAPRLTDDAFADLLVIECGRQKLAQSSLSQYFWNEGRNEGLLDKSGRRRDGRPGLEAFAAAFRPDRKLLVRGDGIPLEEFLAQPVEHWTGA